MNDIQKILEIALRAGNRILQDFRSGTYSVRDKDTGPVTTADLAAQDIILESLRTISSYPIISEETHQPPFLERKNWDYFWLVDPLDGTKEFVSGIPEFTVNIALVWKNKPVLGVICAPALDLAYFATQELGTFKVDRGTQSKIVSSPPKHSRDLRMVESRFHRSTDNISAFEIDGRQVSIRETLRVGSSLKFCYLAEGKADIYHRSTPIMEWDTAAGDSIFRFSGIDGERYSPLTYNQPDLKHGGFTLGLR